MLSSQQQIISFVREHLLHEKPVWLCTILKTWGSSPRPIGAMMACTLDGELVGSISGGCVEEDFLEELREGKLKALYQRPAKPRPVIYGETEAEQARLKLPCGGQLHVLLEFLEPSVENKKVFDEIDSALMRHSTTSRIVNLSNGKITVGILMK